MKFLYVTVCILFFLFQNTSHTYAAWKNVSFEIQLLPWEEVNKILPKYSKFKVLDIETGIEFDVQRRAGSKHADVQPLTIDDTKKMKKIYNGKWSWKRRAIIVIHHDQWIAASMHGMPHGAGVLKNNFPGHFCIHFYGSTTHGQNNMDLSHQLMILKSAGNLKEYINSADPYEMVNIMIAGIKQQDESILSAVSIQQIKWSHSISKIENINLDRMPMLPVEDLINELALEIPVEVSLYKEEVGKSIYYGNIYLYRFTPFEPWKVDTIKFLKENKLYHS